MELEKSYVEKINKQYKKNIKTIASKRGLTLSEISKQLGKQPNYISNMCGKDTIVSNNLIHLIAITFNCTLQELNENI